MSDISRHLFCNFPKLLHVPPFSLSGIGFKIVSWLTHKRCQWARWYLLSFCSWDRKGVTKKHTSYVDMLMLSHLFAIGFPDKMFLHMFVCFFFRCESRGKYVLHTISEIEYAAFQKERPDSGDTFFLYCDGTCLPKEILALVSMISLSLTSLPQKTICVLPEQHANDLEPCLVWHTHTHWYIMILCSP